MKSASIPSAIVFFDFDGTLVRGDSLWMFLLYVCGGSWFRLVWKMIKILPSALMSVFNANRTEKIKQAVCKSVLSQKYRNEIEHLAKEFINVIDRHLNLDLMEILKKHRDRGHKIVVVTASLDCWVCPWAASHGISSVISTVAGFDQDGKFCGFASPNCKGIEKVTATETLFSNFASSKKIGYGNSADDYPLLEKCDEGYLINSHGNVKPFNK